MSSAIYLPRSAFPRSAFFYCFDGLSCRRRRSLIYTRTHADDNIWFSFNSMDLVIIDYYYSLLGINGKMNNSMHHKLELKLNLTTLIFQNKKILEISPWVIFLANYLCTLNWIPLTKDHHQIHDLVIVIGHINRKLHLAAGYWLKILIWIGLWFPGNQIKFRIGFG